MPSSEREIENLIARYAFLVDDGDFTGLGELLDCAEFTLGATTVRGAAPIQRLAAEALQVYADGTPRTRHVTTNLIIEVDERAGTATSRSYYTVLQQTDGFALQPIATGRYHDTFERIGDTWQFASRVVGEQFDGDRSHHLRALRDPANGPSARESD
jgi:3-phenylpropionate/cinnamic acid dioxygenase small subunit